MKTCKTFSKRASFSAAFVLAVSVAGCNSVPKTEIVVVNKCPPLVEYTPRFQLQLAEEIKTASENTKVVVKDYAGLRAACRVDPSKK